MLEPYDGKLSCTVLRRESGSNPADLADNFTALSKYPVGEWNGGKVQFLRPHVIHLMRGQVFTLEGHTFFTMGGASSHDIEDGILDPAAPDYYEKLLRLLGEDRRQYRIVGQS